MITMYPYKVPRGSNSLPKFGALSDVVGAGATAAVAGIVGLRRGLMGLCEGSIYSEVLLCGFGKAPPLMYSTFFQEAVYFLGGVKKSDPPDIWEHAQGLVRVM